mgnify:CR=1 FL=1
MILGPKQFALLQTQVFAIDPYKTPIQTSRCAQGFANPSLHDAGPEQLTPPWPKVSHLTRPEAQDHMDEDEI